MTSRPAILGIERPQLSHPALLRHRYGLGIAMQGSSSGLNLLAIATIVL